MPIKKAQVWTFVRLYGQLKSLGTVVSTLHDKDAEVAAKEVSDLTEPIVNRLLEETHAFLAADSPLHGAVTLPLCLPKHADVMVLVGQLLAAFDAFKHQNVLLRHGRWYWVVEKPNAPNAIEYVLVDPQASPDETN